MVGPEVTHERLNTSLKAMSPCRTSQNAGSSSMEYVRRKRPIMRKAVVPGPVVRKRCLQAMARLLEVNWSATRTGAPAVNWMSSATRSNGQAMKTSATRAQSRSIAATKYDRYGSMRIIRLNAQLTDGGPLVTPVLPTDVAGPPFGAVSGSAPSAILCTFSQSVTLTTKGQVR